MSVVKGSDCFESEDAGAYEQLLELDEVHAIVH